jgi:type I restriction enzyme S subunit
MQSFEKKTTKNFEVPGGWIIESIGTYVNILSGEYFPYNKFSNEGIPVLKIDNVVYGKIDWTNKTYLPQNYLSSHKHLILNEDDIVLALNRPITNNQVKVAQVRKRDTPSILYQRVGKFEFIQNKTLDKKFFFVYLTSPIFKITISKSLIGSDQPYVKTTELRKKKFVIPPIKEQQKIASILSNVDELIQKTEQIIEQTQRLKKGLMHRLLTKGIRHTKFKKIDWLFGKKIEIPEEWNIVSLRDVCKNITDGKHGDCENEYNSGYYFISAKDIFDGKIHYENARQITKSDFIESHKRTKIESGDILLTNSGSIGKLAIVENVFSTSRTTFQKSVAILKPDIEKIFVKFVYYYLFHYQKQLETIASGSSQKNLLLRQLDSFKIILPLIYEQQKIGHILSNLDSNIQNQKDQKSILENIKKGLMQQLLTGKIRVKVK